MAARDPVDTATRGWNNRRVLDLNDVRIFEKVAASKSFTSAARALGLPKSTVSRSIARLEEELGVRLFQRTTREVALTPTGEQLRDRCAGILDGLAHAVDHVRSSTAAPRGRLHITAGVGFGINVLADELPGFLARYPELSVALDLSSRTSDLLADGVDVAIRLGPMVDSDLVSVRLGAMTRHLCAAPAYLDRRGAPESIDDLVEHDTIEMPGTNGRPRSWTFARDGETKTLELVPRISVNEALTIYRLIMNGAGIGIVSGYLCTPAFATRQLVPVLRDWSVPAIDVNIVFASKRELSPNIREFVNYMKEVSAPKLQWNT